MAQARTPWESGAVFAVPLPDGTYAIGQAIASMMTNVIYCAFTRLRYAELPLSVQPIERGAIISRQAVTREQLDYGVWRILGVGPLVCSKSEFRNEQFAANGYVGATLIDAAVAEEFLAAYHALVPWDDWFQVDYLDSLLVSPGMKPKALVWKHGPPAAS